MRAMSKFRSHTRAPEAQKRLAAERREQRCLNEHKALQGEVWRADKLKSADRMLYDKPINKQAQKELRKYKKD